MKSVGWMFEIRKYLCIIVMLLVSRSFCSRELSVGATFCDVSRQWWRVSGTTMWWWFWTTTWPTQDGAVVTPTAMASSVTNFSTQTSGYSASPRWPPFSMVSLMSWAWAWGMSSGGPNRMSTIGTSKLVLTSNNYNSNFCYTWKSKGWIIFKQLNLTV